MTESVNLGKPLFGAASQDMMAKTNQRPTCAAENLDSVGERRTSPGLRLLP